MYDTVIFDMDGTLLNTLDDIRDSVNHIMRKYDFPEREEEEVCEAIGNGARHLMECCVPGGDQNPRFEEILEDYSAYYRDHCQNKTRPYDTMIETLKELQKRNIKTAIVSNKDNAAVQQLAELYFDGLIDVAVGEQEGVSHKPAPDELLKALEEMGKDVDTALYVGDTEVDYETANNANMAVILVSWGFRDRDQIEKLNPGYLIDSPAEILEIVQTDWDEMEEDQEETSWE